MSTFPSTAAPVLQPNGNVFTTVWYRFLQQLAGAAAQPGQGIVDASGAVPANGQWLAAQGAAVSRTVYASLFAVIGVSYGPGDAVTTFNLPNWPSPGAPAIWLIHV